MFKKQFKDPIYGYIEIDSSLVAKIIDTPSFQRLKDIRQTSYTPLFPAAYHNRYVHSLGVYHLGCIAFNAIKPQIETVKNRAIKAEHIEESNNTEVFSNIEIIQKTFELACLLHDIGHAPFSHTGEAFFLDEENILYKDLKESVNEDYFSADFDALGTKKPAPHECMSCIVGLKVFSDNFKSKMERSVFARCIIGMPIRFTEKPPEQKNKINGNEKVELAKKREAYKAKKTAVELLNCVISLLNSSIIDVDRLDYIIRDAATIGFKSVQVDYLRLLNGMRIVEFEKALCVGYHKSALSVIESAIYAHDAEKKWIQNHPSILYEMEALKSAMSSLTSVFASDKDPNPIFCYDALTEEGKKLVVLKPLFTSDAQKLEEEIWSTEAKKMLNNGTLFEKELCICIKTLSIIREYPVSLLADEDILYLMKVFCKNGLGYEYFARNRRRSAVWKSEAEFRALFQERIGDDTKAIKTLENDFEGLMEYCQSKTGVPVVNKNIYAILDQEEGEANLAKQNEEIDRDSFEDIIRGINKKRHWSTILLDTASLLGIEPEFLIIFQKRFNSSFRASIGEIPILFPNLNGEVVPLENVVDVLKSSVDRKSNFFHLFYKPVGAIKEEEKRTIVNEIAKKLIDGTNYK